MAEKLSKAQCILLAVSHASDSQITSLQQLQATTATTGSLPAELVLRILLTYLPAIVPPSSYIPLVKALGNGTTVEPPGGDLDLSAVQNIPNSAADKQLRRLSLLPLKAPNHPTDAPEDPVTLFVCHRAYRIDEETGLWAIISDLVIPFALESEYLRLWYLSAVLPLFRFRHTYYPDLDVASDLSIAGFEAYDGKRGTALLLSGAKETGHEIVSDYESTGTMGRDLKSVVGPWLYGHTSRRKRRRLSGPTQPSALTNGTDDGTTKMKHTDDDAGRTWDTVYTWLVHKAVYDFPLATSAIENWNGPEDLDLGESFGSPSFESEEAKTLTRKRFAQTAFAICYAVEDDTAQAIAGAHGILVRLANLLDFEPPPDLATSIDQLPRVDRHAAEIEDSESQSILQVNNLLRSDHPLTAPVETAFMLLQMLVYSAYQFSGLGYKLSIINVTKLRYFSTADEQLQLLQRILKGLTQGGKRDDLSWSNDRGRLLWLWDWSIDPGEESTTGSGPLGNINRDMLEKEILSAMIMTGNFQNVKDTCLSAEQHTHTLTSEDVESRILGEAIKAYDNASNGNRTRGGMKKAADIVSTFAALFPKSSGLRRASSLIAATHSMSFYTLILQHGIPFQPINIRIAPDPQSLLEQILEQNPNAYTNLDDLIEVGRNLAVALPKSSSISSLVDDRCSAEILLDAKNAERRVIFMCISAALRAHDFDTAYSYLINRLSSSAQPPSQPVQGEAQDDISWRAALLAGRYRPPPTASAPDTNEQIRRLEQRTELLSLSLRLAPLSALTEILNVYRRCEEEMTSLQSQRAEAEHAHDDILARQRGAQPAPTGRGDVPGGFGALGINDGRVYGQSTREVGRLLSSAGPAPDHPASALPASSASRRGVADRDSQPVGLFDLASGAAAALRRQAFPLGRSRAGPGGGGGTSPTPSGGSGVSGPGPGPAPSTPAPPAPSSRGRDPSLGGAWGGTGDGTEGNAGNEQDGEEDWGAEWGAGEGEDGPQQAAEDEAWGWNEGGASSALNEDEGGAWGEASRVSMDSSGSGGGGERVRRRDMVASAVSGSLASGIGWVLGATPNAGQQQQQQR